jgi:hypothetical protein
MPYIIKMRKVKAYVTNFYKYNNRYDVSYHKHINKAKIWKTEKGVKNALLNYIEKSDDNIKDFMIVEKTNSQLGIFESGNIIQYKYKPKEKEEKKLKKIKINKLIIKKLYKNMISFFKYIIKELKIYLLIDD